MFENILDLKHLKQFECVLIKNNYKSNICNKRPASFCKNLIDVCCFVLKRINLLFFLPWHDVKKH